MYADGALPAPASYGVPDCWPHVHAALERAGFVPGDPAEIVLLARVSDLPAAGDAPLEGLEQAHLAFATRLGRRELARTQRGWRREERRASTWSGSAGRTRR